MHKQIVGAAAAAALLLFSSAPLAGQTSLASDAEFLAWAADNSFVKLFGGNARAGNYGPSGDWEFSIVDGADVPLNQKQVGWSGWYSFLFTASVAGAAEFSFYSNGTLVGTSSATVDMTGLNTLAFRARARDGRDAELRNVRVTDPFATELLFFAALEGDGDAEYAIFQDARFADGFTMTGEGYLAGGSGSDPMYQFKAGSADSVVPEPMSMVLLGTGLAGLAGAARRRRRTA